MDETQAMSAFHPAVWRWFEGRFPQGPSEPQTDGWPAIRRREHTLIAAPTGSLVSVPNGRIASAQVDNLGARERRRLRITLGFTYDAKREQISQFITQVRDLFEAEALVDDESIFSSEE